MALAVSMRFDFIDEAGRTSFTKVRVPTGFSLPQYTEFAQAFGQLLIGVSVGQITRASFCVGLDLSTSTIKAAATLFADIAQKAMFGFSTVVAGLRTKLKIPAFDENLINAGSDDVDIIAPAVANFLAAMEDGIVVTGGTISPCDSRENDVNNTDFGRELFRRT